MIRRKTYTVTYGNKAFSDKAPQSLQIDSYTKTTAASETTELREEGLDDRNNRGYSYQTTEPS